MKDKRAILPIMNLYGTPGISCKGPIKQNLFVLPSFHNSFSLSRCILGIGLLLFCKFWHGAGNPCEVVHDSQSFWKKLVFPQKQGKGAICSIIKSFYYLLHTYANPIFGKNLVSEIQAKMLSASQIAGVLNQSYILNKVMKWADFFVY